jgi:subtilisin family serine protease
VSSPAQQSADWSAKKQKIDRIILVPKRGLQTTQDAAFYRGRHRRLLKEFPKLGRIQVVQLAEGESMEAAVEEYRASGRFQVVEPDHKLHARIVPNDPEFTSNTLWGLRNQGQNGGTSGADIHATAGWDILHSAPNVIVAVIDSGIRYTHEDLAANMWKNPNEIPDNGLDDDNNGIVDDVYGINSINNSGEPLDDNGHGTHVAGIIGAVGNNGQGITGVAWQVQLMALKFLDNTGNGETSDAIQCIDYAREHGAKIINASWGGDEEEDALLVAVQQARDAGIIFVTAAGNESANNDLIVNNPANFDLDNMVVVCATTRNDTFDSSYSNFSSTKVHLAAPGTGIYSTWFHHDADYRQLSGTSMAAPCVSGILALMSARFPTETHQQLIKRLLAATDTLPSLSGKCSTGGRVNLEKALGGGLTADFSMSTSFGEFPLTVAFTNVSSSQIVRQTWDFGDGASSSETNAAHTFGLVGHFNVSLTVTDAAGKTASKSKTVTVYPSYEIVDEPFNWIDPLTLSDRQEFGLTDNGISNPVDLPFAFPFYAIDYTNIFLAANGLAGFSNSALNVSINQDIPSQTDPNALICPYWADLNPSLGGKISMGTLSSEAAVVLTWENVPLNLSANDMTFQTLLYPNGEIVFQYLEVHPEDFRGGGAEATVGIENETGTLASKYCFNGLPHSITNERAIRFRAKRMPFLQLTAPPLSFNGHFGGPFLPEHLTIALTNTGSVPLEWSAESSTNLFLVEPVTGHLDPRASTNLNVSISNIAANLSAGHFTGLLTVTNLSNALGSQTLPITLALHSTLSLRTVPEASESDFHIRFGADPETLYVIEASTDLNNWSAISTNGPAAGATIDFTQPLEGERRFYRARSLAQ